MTSAANCHQFKQHRQQILPPVFLVLLIPVAILPPVSTIPATNCHRYQRRRLPICHPCKKTLVANTRNNYQTADNLKKWTWRKKCIYMLTLLPKSVQKKYWKFFLLKIFSIFFCIFLHMSKTVCRTVQKNSNSGTVLTGRTLILGSHNTKITCFCPFKLFTKQDRRDLRWNALLPSANWPLVFTAQRELRVQYRVSRVPGFLSSRRNWVPHLQGSFAPPPLWVQGGRQTRLRVRGWGGPNSEEGTEALILWYKNQQCYYTLKWP